MAAAQLWGADKYDKLDPITVTRSHPDAVAALLSGKSEINSHFASAPITITSWRSPASISC
jgi:NitT/TauT family transport system substrate-binding protein